MTKAIVLVSGGVDSAVVLSWAVNQDWNVTPITFDYYSRPVAEKTAILRLLRKMKIGGLISVPVGFLREVEDLAKKGRLTPGLRKAPDSYIPARNLVFYSVAAYHAEIIGADVIVGGHNQGDPESFPDSSSWFLGKIEELLHAGLWSRRSTPIRIVLPLRNKTKLEVVRMGVELGTPLELTWSCHRDGKKPCGKCSSCIDRDRAFAAAGIGSAHLREGGKGIYRRHSS